MTKRKEKTPSQLFNQHKKIQAAERRVVVERSKLREMSKEFPSDLRALVKDGDKVYRLSFDGSGYYRQVSVELICQVDELNKVKVVT